jgi:hypothetical protein
VAAGHFAWQFQQQEIDFRDHPRWQGRGSRQLKRILLESGKLETSYSDEGREVIMTQQLFLISAVSETERAAAPDRIPVHD